MIYMYRIGVIGDFDSICGFYALGLDVFSVQSAEEAEEQLKKLCAGEYGVVYITEPLMQELKDSCGHLLLQQLPAIIPIPTGAGATGFAQQRMRDFVKQAVGSDIIFGS